MTVVTHAERSDVRGGTPCPCDSQGHFLRLRDDSLILVRAWVGEVGREHICGDW